MAKGDDSRARNAVTYAQKRGTDLNESTRTGILGPQLDAFRNYYQDSANRGIAERGNILSTFNDKVIPGYQNFATTGGFSPTDIASIRSRALSGASSVYGNAKREVDRQRSLQGGYSPGYGTLIARMAREKSGALSDANMNVEAGLAQMINQNKLAGLSGLGETGSRMSSLYGTGPGEASTFGNQVLQGTNQYLTSIGQEQNNNMDAARAMIAAGALPGKTQSTIGNISGILGLGQQVAGMGAGGIYPWLNPSGGSTGWSFPGRQAPM